MLKNTFVRIAIILVLVLALYYLVVVLARGVAAAEWASVGCSACAAGIVPIASPRPGGRDGRRRRAN